MMPRPVKTLYRARSVRTLGEPRSGEWILVDGRHVRRVGSGPPPEADRVVHLPGATLVPGMIDAHVHLGPTGLAIAQPEVAAARSAAQLLDIARAEASAGPERVVLRGFDESGWDDPSLPPIDALDGAVEVPLAIRRTDGHLALVNEAAIRAAELADLDGLERDAQGRSTGIVRRAANERLGRWLVEQMSDLELQDAQLRGAALAASRGVTAVHEMAMSEEAGIRELQVFLEQRSRLPVDALPIVATTDIAMAIDLGMSSVGGDLPVDGSIGARTAAVSGPYLDGDGDGTLYHADDELAEFFHGGHAAGLQVGVHAIGDLAIEQVLRVWERVYASLDSRERRHFRARRHRIEHMVLASDAQVERSAVLGLAASVQPSFDLDWGAPGGLYARRLGEARAAAAHPFRTMIDRGLEIGVGSDAPVTALDPWRTIHALEQHHDPAQRVTRVEAIRAHTRGSARLGHQEEKKGALDPGAHADLAAYQADPFEVEDVLGLAPILTISLGREVFAS